MKYGWRIKYDVTGMVERVKEKKGREREEKKSGKNKKKMLMFTRQFRDEITFTWFEVFPWRRINMFAGTKPVVLRSQNKVSLAVNF